MVGRHQSRIGQFTPAYLAADQKGMTKDERGREAQGAGPPPAVAPGRGVGWWGRGEAGGEEPPVEAVLHGHNGEGARKSPLHHVVGQEGR